MYGPTLIIVIKRLCQGNKEIPNPCVHSEVKEPQRNKTERTTTI